MSPASVRAAAAGQGRIAHWRLVTMLSLLVVAFFGLSLSTGPAGFGFVEGLERLIGGGGGFEALIMREIRLPRAILGVLVGATMGVTGAALQGLLRNPLAEPGLIGVSASAAFGAVMMLYFGISATFPMALPLGGMAGALVSVVLVFFLAGREASVLTLILAGVAVNSLAGALTALALNMAPSPYAALEIAFWLLGSLSDRSMEHVALAMPLAVAGLLLLVRIGRPLDALTLGEDTARSLGYNLTAVRWRLVLATALAVGASVSVAGSIGFVGLVVPHLMRPLVGHQPGRLLGVSALGGAVLVLAADTLVRVISPDRELKLGVVTALIGAPFFLYLVLHARRAMR